MFIDLIMAAKNVLLNIFYEIVFHFIKIRYRKYVCSELKYHSNFGLQNKHIKSEREDLEYKQKIYILHQ